MMLQRSDLIATIGNVIEEDTLTRWFDIARDNFHNYYGGDISNDRDKEIICNLVAHLMLTMEMQRTGVAMNRGQVASESVGDVSVSYSSLPMDRSEAWWNLTNFGSKYKLLTSYNLGSVFV